jgi:hypothetical protein
MENEEKINSRDGDMNLRNFSSTDFIVEYVGELCFVARWIDSRLPFGLG